MARGAGGGGDTPLGLDQGELSVIMFVVVSFGILYFISIYFTIPWSFLKQLEIKAILCFDFVLFADYEQALRTVLYKLQHKEAKSISIESVQMVENLTRFPMCIFYSVIGGLLALKVFMRPDFTQKHTMETLIAEQTKTVWRFNRHLIKMNPFNEGLLDVRNGPYAIRDRPVHFCRRNKIVVPNDIHDPSAGFKLDREQARKSLMEQINADCEFTTFYDLTFNEKIIAAAIILFICKDLKSAVDMAGDGSFYHAGEMSEKKIIKKVTDVFDKYGNDPRIRASVEKHFFVSGVLRSLYVTAKGGGIFTTALFSWLLPQARLLYLFLNDEGIPEGSIECCGLSAHYYRELDTGRRIETVDLDMQITEIENKMRSINVIK